jgi:chemotaxis protein CheC
MSSISTDPPHREILKCFEHGAESASRALSTWIDGPVRLTVGGVAMVDLVEATGILGDPEILVTACSLGLAGGRLSGQVILVFEDRAGFALVDQLTRQPIGTTTSWGDLERSAAEETTNILGCAFLNALAEHLPMDPDHEGQSSALIPAAPKFFHEFAGSLLEFALADQATELDRVLVIRSRFTAESLGHGPGVDLSLTLLFVPSAMSLRALMGSSDQTEASEATSGYDDGYPALEC